MTPTYSSLMASGGCGGIPNLAFITAFPTPRPRMNRPSAAWSSCAAVLAASAGARSRRRISRLRPCRRQAPSVAAVRWPATR